MQRFALALDVGGTFLKSALIGSNGEILKKSLQRIPINAQGSKETIIGTFVRIMKLILQITKDRKLNVVGVGIGMPGPFDYQKGISLMKHKFEAIHGLNLKQEFIKCLKLKKDFLIRFEHDAGVFLRGEAWRGAAQGYNRIVGLTIGSGLGAAFMIDSQIVNKNSGMPLYSIWSRPYKNGIVEDKVSRHGIITRYRELVGRECPNNIDVKEIAFRALKDKDKISLQVFEEFGSILGEALKPIISDFEAECLVLGGQISKSFSLFAKPLEEKLRSVSQLKKVTSSQLIDLSALYGAAKLVFESLSLPIL